MATGTLASIFFAGERNEIERKYMCPVSHEHFMLPHFYEDEHEPF